MSNRAPSNVEHSLTCVDLFAGCGGFSLGFRDEGFRIIAQLDSDTNACQTLRSQFSATGTTVINKDILMFSMSYLKGLLSRKKVSILDILIGGPPCTGFSTLSNRRGVPKAPGEPLILKFFEILAYLKPRMFLLENVDHILKCNDEEIKHTIIDLSDQRGYKINYSILDSNDFGVPQNRKRAFFMGNRIGRKNVFPKRSNSQNGLWDAISDLPPLKAGEGREDGMKYRSEPRNEYQNKLRTGMNGYVYNHQARNHSELNLRRIGVLRQGQNATHLPPNLKPRMMNHFKDKFRRLKARKPSPTIIAHLKTDGNRFIHPSQDRSITAREAARIQSFPDSFIFNVSMTHQFSQLGNAVPYFVSKALARSVKRILN